MMINKIINYLKDDSLKIVYFNNSINIVNYEKILEVKDNIVSLVKLNKIINIRGNKLKLNKLLDNEILITGLISKIEL